MQRRAVLVDEAPFGSDPVMPELSERFGHFHSQAVQEQVVPVVITAKSSAARAEAVAPIVTMWNAA